MKQRWPAWTYLHTKDELKAVFPGWWDPWLAQCVGSRLTDNHSHPDPHLISNTLPCTPLSLLCFVLPEVEGASVSFSVKWEGGRKENLQVYG